jgi:hypothetical protein
MKLQSFRCLSQSNGEKKEVALIKCENHLDKACLSGEFPSYDDRSGKTRTSSVYWQAGLFELDVENGRKTDIPLKRLEGDKEKKDHYSNDHNNNTLESWPRFQAELEPFEPNISRIFVASFRLSECDETPSKATPTHEAISDFVRIGPRQARGTAAMWQSIFNDRQDKMDCISELCEVSIFGRCLEKILGVDLVPAILPLDAKETLPPDCQDIRPLALVSNMFLKASVDLKSLL